MSLGYEGVCKLVDQDDEIAIYVYSGADIDCKTQIAYRFDLDGVITIYYQENGILPEHEMFMQ